MYPGFRSDWQRRFNKSRLTKAINQNWQNLGIHPSQSPATHRIILTTLPITADLVPELPAQWVYYCVDDFSQWPGCDQHVMDTMERQLVSDVDQIICVSQTLRSRIASMGRTDTRLLTHGIHLDHWSKPPTHTQNLPSNIAAKLNWLSSINGPIFLFWGLIDERLDLDFVDQLSRTARRAGGKLVLTGPEAKPNPRLHQLMGEGPTGLAVPGLSMTGNIPYQFLPHFAHAADVLVMPYIDAPVTHAMQPLKLKEYLATGKPVICRNLPATHAWCDACDLASDPHAFTDIAMLRSRVGIDPHHTHARQRLHNESWSEKTALLYSLLTNQPFKIPSSMHTPSLIAAA
ncbi:Putative teichuronic acid biosynthesis glycosyltransferase TuaH [Poriferisphaera corsica]|uniref:Teichuronic acid biosynthesis glycosyltransferase TuaH n=2 Tax=Poriferisphaera corsica TaxID=2528020 RepID=A0A517YVZ2_9BACT|nr:Putative teichuronic acid biosynthesis glycosyltransferase TuaH [Poriferisphaera corsica]